MLAQVREGADGPRWLLLDETGRGIQGDLFLSRGPVLITIDGWEIALAEAQMLGMDHPAYAPLFERVLARFQDTSGLITRVPDVTEAKRTVPHSSWLGSPHRRRALRTALLPRR